MDGSVLDSVEDRAMLIGELPIIDSQFREDLTANKVAMTRELFSLFVSTLLEEQAKINDSYRNKDYKLLRDLLHSLYGAACYCGVPRLKETIAIADTVLQDRCYDKLDRLLISLDSEIKLVMSYAEQAGFVVGAS